MEKNNEFDYSEIMGEVSGGADDAGASTETDSAVSKSEKKTEDSEPVKNDFDYTDDISKMEEDAGMDEPDSDTDSGESDGEDNSADDSKGDAKANASATTDPTQEQLFKAAQLGLTLDDVRGLTSAEVDVALRTAERVKPPSDNSDDKDGGDAEDDAVFRPIELEGLDEFDEDTQGLVKGLQDQFNTNLEKMAEQVKTLKEQLSVTTEGATQQAQAQFFEWFDGRVDKLGEDWSDVFGADPNGLVKGSTEVKNRISLMEEMDKLAVVHPEYTQEKLFDAALKMVFPSEIDNKKEQSAKRSKDTYRQDRSTMRPTSRNRSIENMPEGREKALAAVKDIGKKKKFFGLFS